MFDNRLNNDNSTYQTPYTSQCKNLNINDLFKQFNHKKGENNDVFSLGAPDEIRTHIVGTGNRNSIH